MKIIKKGKLKLKIDAGECSKCGCIFKYTSDDIKIDQRDGNYVECPTCGAFIAAGQQPPSFVDRSRDC